MLERPFLLRYVVASNQSHRKILIRTLVVTLVLLSTSCGDSSNQEDLLNQARRLMAEGQHEQANTALREVIRSYQDDPEARLLLSEVYLELNQARLAQTTLEQALERGLDPNIYIGRSKRFELSVMSLGKVDTPVRRRKYFSSGASKAT